MVEVVTSTFHRTESNLLSTNIIDLYLQMIDIEILFVN